MATYEFSSDSIKRMLARFAKATDGAVKGAKEALREDAKRERGVEHAGTAGFSVVSAPSAGSADPSAALGEPVAAHVAEIPAAAATSDTSDASPVAVATAVPSTSPARTAPAPKPWKPSVPAQMRPQIWWDNPFDRLTEGERRAYSRLSECVLLYKDAVQIEGATEAEIERAYHAFLYDTPEVFYVKGFTLARAALPGNVWKATPDYTYSQDEAMRMLAEMEERAKPLVDALAALETDEQRVQLAHNALILNCAYSDTGDPLEATAAGPLLNGKGVCAGVALAFMYLMDRVGVPCRVVRGQGWGGVLAGDSASRAGGNAADGNAAGVGGSTLSVDAREGAEPHAWNLVRAAKGAWTHVDVTYDLGQTANKRRPHLAYLGLCDIEAHLTRSWDTDAYPQAGYSMEPYRRRGRYVRDWDELAGLFDLTLARDGFCAVQLDERLISAQDVPEDAPASGERDVPRLPATAQEIFKVAERSLRGHNVAGRKLVIRVDTPMRVFEVELQ